MTNTHSTNGHRALLAVMTVFLLLLVSVVAPAVHADTPPPGKLFFTGDVSLGSVATDILPFHQDRADSAIVSASLTLHNLPGNATFMTSYRQPLFGASFWNQRVEKFTGEFRVPVSRDVTAFAFYERNPASGFEWGWVGVTVPFSFKL